MKTIPEQELQLIGEAPELVAAEGNDGPAKFRMVAYTGGAMRPYGWGERAVVDLAGLKFGQKMPVRADHDRNKGVGHTTGVRVEGARLLVEGVVSRGTPEAREIVEAARNGFPWQSSIGAIPEEREFVAAGQYAEVNGQRFRGPLVVVRKARMQEVSFVDVGADGKTSARIAAREGSNVSMEGNDTNVESQDRIDAITTLAADHPKILARALTENWDADRTELEVLRARDREHELQATRDARTAAPGVISRGRVADDAVNLTPKNLTAAMLHAIGASDVAEAQCGADAAQRGQDLLAGGDHHDVLRLAYNARGETAPRNRVVAFEQEMLLQASAATVSLPTILGDVIHKIAAFRYMQRPLNSRQIADVVVRNDFHARNILRMIAGAATQKIGEHGELPSSMLAEETATVEPDTYGLILMVTRKAWLNGPEDILRDMPRLMADDVRRKHEDEFFAALTGEAGSHFNATNANYITGADTALSVAGLSEARQAMREQTDADSRYIDMEPHSVLVAPANESTLRQLLNSDDVARDVSSSDQLATGNPHKGTLVPLIEPRLTDADKAWYLFARPEARPMQLTYVGSEDPKIERVQLPPQQLGWGFRVYLDFGVALGDPRAAVKSLGEAE
jgi:hypothetical protein